MEKKQVIIFILVTVFAVLVGGFGGYALYASMSEPEQKETENKPTPVPTSLPEVVENPALLEKLSKSVVLDKTMATVLPNGACRDFADWQKILLTAFIYQKELVSHKIPNGFDGVIQVSQLREKAKILFGEEVTYEDQNYPEFKSYPLRANFDNITYENLVYEKDKYLVPDYYTGYGLHTKLYFEVPYQLTKQGNTYTLKRYRAYKEVSDIGIRSTDKYYSDPEQTNVILDLTGSKYEYTDPEYKMYDDTLAKLYRITEQEEYEEIRKNAKKGHMVVATYTFEQVGDSFLWTNYQLDKNQ